MLAASWSWFFILRKNCCSVCEVSATSISPQAPWAGACSTLHVTMVECLGKAPISTLLDIVKIRADTTRSSRRRARNHDIAAPVASARLARRDSLSDCRHCFHSLSLSVGCVARARKRGFVKNASRRVAASPRGRDENGEAPRAAQGEWEQRAGRVGAARRASGAWQRCSGGSTRVDLAPKLKHSPVATYARTAEAIAAEVEIRSAGNPSFYRVLLQSRRASCACRAPEQNQQKRVGEKIWTTQRRWLRLQWKWLATETRQQGVQLRDKGQTQAAALTLWALAPSALNRSATTLSSSSTGVLRSKQGSKIVRCYGTYLAK